MSVYIPKHFKAQELVSRTVYQRILNSFKNNTDELIFSRFDDRLLYTLDQQWEYYNGNGQKHSIIINDWLFGGSRQFSGFRASYDNFKSGEWSLHRYFKAFDYLVGGVPAAEVRQDIKKNQWQERNKYITAIEDFPGMDWTHIDSRNWNKQKSGLYIFNKPG